MLRWLKVLPLTLTLGAFSFLSLSCTSSHSSQVRVLNAIPDGQEVDVEVNGTKEFSELSFGNIQPSQPGYTNVPSGSDTFQAVLTGTTTTAPPDSTLTLSGSTQYLVILTGFNNDTQGTDAPAAVPFTDNNTAPTSGNLEFRIINASPSSPQGGVDIYIEPNPFNGDLTGLNPQISALGYPQASSYQSVTVNSQGSGFAVLVTAAGNKTALINQTYNPTNSGTTGETITTIVLVDVTGGGQMSEVPIELSDLN